MTDSLSGLRGRVGNPRTTVAKRFLPEPAHPAAKEIVQPPASADDLPADTATESATTDRPNTKRRTATKTGPAGPRAATSTPELIRQTVYLDDDADELLESVRSASRKRRVDANRSAVIRLALRRLAADITPTQIVDEIAKASKAADHTRPGRRLV